MYLDTSHQKLGLYLIHKDIDVTNFNVIKTLSKKSGPYDIEFGILGTSHYVKYRNGSDVFCELFSCKPLLEQGLYYPISALKKTSEINERILNNRSYNFKSEVHFLDEAKYLYDYYKKLDSSKAGVFHEFPGNPNLEFRPYTSIVCDHTEVLLINTIHVYPEENIIVSTKSKLV